MLQASTVHCAQIPKTLCCNRQVIPSPAMDNHMLEISKWKNRTKNKSSRKQIYQLSTLLQTKNKIRNPVKQIQLNNSCFTDPSSMFKDSIMAASPIPHVFPFKMPFPQSLSIDFKVISRYWFMPTPHQVPQTQTQIKPLLLKVYTPVDLVNSFLIISHPISYRPLKLFTIMQKFVIYNISQFCVSYSIAIISSNKLVTSFENL